MKNRSNAEILKAVVDELDSHIEDVQNAIIGISKTDNIINDINSSKNKIDDLDKIDGNGENNLESEIPLSTYVARAEISMLKGMLEILMDLKKTATEVEVEVEAEETPKAQSNLHQDLHQDLHPVLKKFYEAKEAGFHWADKAIENFNEGECRELTAIHRVSDEEIRGSYANALWVGFYWWDHGYHKWERIHNSLKH